MNFDKLCPAFTLREVQVKLLVCVSYASPDLSLLAPTAYLVVTKKCEGQTIQTEAICPVRQGGHVLLFNYHFKAFGERRIRLVDHTKFWPKEIANLSQKRYVPFRAF